MSSEAGAIQAKQAALGKVVFVAGVHGVGKSTLCSQVKMKGLVHKSASALIKQEKSEAIPFSGKSVKDIRGNQELLVGAVNRIRSTGQTLLLDGHFAILDKDSCPQTIPYSVYSELGVRAIFLMHDSSATIYKRLEERDGASLSKGLISALQAAEISHAHIVSEALCVPLYSFNSSSEANDFSLTLTSMCQG